MSLTAEDRSHSAPMPDYLAPIAGELRRVEETLASELDSGVEMVRDVTRHILEAGGKRLRPSLVILGARASLGAPVSSSASPACEDTLSPNDDHLIRVAAVAELIHMATLMHDDVIDGAESRRGRITANHRWSNQVSVLTGDYMLARAFAMLSRDGDVPVMRALSQATVAMSEGEIRQIELSGDIQGLAREYLSICAGKTAAFMSTCCRTGAICARGASEVEESLAEYGMNVGLAFQITDDLLDLIGDPALTGKPVGGDIREGKVTLPVIITMERVAPDDRTLIEGILEKGNATPADVELVRRLVEETGSIEATREAAAEYIDRARLSIRPLPHSIYRESLELLAEGILSRRK